MYALLDSGANCSAISESLCLRLEIPIVTQKMSLSTFDGRDVSERGIASFHVANLTETIHHDVTKAVVGKIFYSEAEVPPHPAHILQLPPFI